MIAGHPFFILIALYGMELNRDSQWLPLLLAWVVTLAGTLGSLFFSEVMKFPPCSLCWYQRVALYPLVAVFAVGFLFRDKKVGRYAWPLVGFGLAAAVYHLLLYYKVLPESVAPCTQGVSCSTKQVEWFGFVTIPLLSLIGFSLIAGLLGLFHKNSRSEL